jgi:branched-chain amino acid transport system permease protein
MKGMPPRGMVLGLVALAVAAAVLLPLVVPNFMLFQISIMLTYAIAVLGLNLLLGFAGQVSLAQGAFFACGAYVYAILAARYGVPHTAALACAAGLTVVLGVAVGLPALRLPGLQLAIVTFGLAALVPQILIKFDHITGGEAGIRIRRPALPAWYPGGLESWNYYCCLIGLALCMLIMLRALHGDSGRSLKALRDNPLVAQSFGVDPTRVRLAAFAVAAAFAGLAGGLFAMVNGFVNPSSFEATKSIEILIGAIVGGVTSIPGAIIGAVFIVFVPDWTSQIDISLAGFLYGSCLILTMLFARNGLTGLARTLLGYWAVAGKGAATRGDR